MKAKRDVTRFCAAQGWKCDVLYPDGYPALDTSDYHVTCLGPNPEDGWSRDKRHRQLWKRARRELRATFPELWHAFMAEQAAARDATAPVDPAPVSPDYEALVRAWYAEHGMGDPVVRCPAGVKFWIGHAMSNGLWGYMALNAADTPELAWQAAWEYLSSPPESHTAPSIPAQHDHIGDAPTMVDAPNLVQSGPSSQTEQAARERMEELERAALVLAKTVQRALDEYLAPQGVHSTAFTAALAQPAIVALLEERGAE